MYHTIYPPQMMVQMGSQQTNGQYPLTQTHALNVNVTNTLHQTEYTQYIPNISDYNRHHMMQAGSYPLELLQLMGVEIPSLRHIDYIQTNSNSPSGHWQRRIVSSSGAPMIPTSHVNFRPNNDSLKKTNWNNKIGKRSSYRDSLLQSEKYNSVSGFSSRSSTLNKYDTTNSQTESSDERDSITSSIEQGVKNLHKVSSDHYTINKIAQGSFISSTSAHQFYQNQRPINYYHTTISAPRSVQNYQNKRRYHSGRNSPPPQRPQRGRRFTGVIVPSYNMFPRYYTAPDRFLARSHLIEITRTPDNLITGSIWDDLSQAIWTKFISNQQTEAIYKNKMMLWKNLYIYIKTVFPKYGLFLVGSTMNGFGSDSSDVDMCLLVRHTEMDQRIEAIGHLEQILKCLKRCDFIEQLELIQAKVPILKFHDAMQNLDVDLNCNNAVGIRNTHLLYCYSRIDWRVRPLVLVVKLWAQCQDINNAKNMTISSYSLALMVIHFLQCGVTPPVLPCLHNLYEGKFGPHTDIHSIDIHEDLKIPLTLFFPKNCHTLGELFIEFFRYYVMFNFSQYAISVRLANKIPIEDCRKVRSQKNEPYQWKYLCIEGCALYIRKYGTSIFVMCISSQVSSNCIEPFDLTNTARSVYDRHAFARIKQVFGRTYQKLKESHDLASIFVKVDTMSPYVIT